MSRLCCVFLCALLLVVGCNQETKTVSPQVADQQTVTPATTAQDQTTAGSDVNIWIINAPGNAELPDGGDGEPVDVLEKVVAPGVDVGKTRGRAVQAGIVVNVNTGSTTPTATGSAQSTGQGTQTPSMANNQNPVQDVKPEFTSAVPITFGMPGSAVSGTANAAGSGGQLSNPNTSNTQTPQFTDLNFRVPANYAGDVTALLKEYFDMRAAGKQPVLTTQPE